MKYTFNPFTGRLSTPTPLEVPSKYGKGAEDPRIQFIENTKIQVADTPLHRGRYAPVPDKLQARMRTFQMPNGLPVHIKGGPVDKILYGITAAVCFVGVLECVHVWYTLSYPPPPKSE